MAAVRETLGTSGLRRTANRLDGKILSRFRDIFKTGIQNPCPYLGPHTYLEPWGHWRHSSIRLATRLVQPV
jgi:hypothetical protein